MRASGAETSVGWRRGALGAAVGAFIATGDLVLASRFGGRLDPPSWPQRIGVLALLTMSAFLRLDVLASRSPTRA